MGQGESSATFVNPLVQRQSACCEAGDRKSRQTDSWRGRRNLGHAKQKSTGDLSSAAKGISPSATATNLYPKKEWQTQASGHPRHALPRDASFIFACSRSPSRNARRPQFLRLQDATLTR